MKDVWSDTDSQRKVMRRRLTRSEPGMRYSATFDHAENKEGEQVKNTFAGVKAKVTTNGKILILRIKPTIKIMTGKSHK